MSACSFTKVAFVPEGYFSPFPSQGFTAITLHTVFFGSISFHFVTTRNVASAFKRGGLQVCLQAIVKIEREREKQVNYMFP